MPETIYVADDDSAILDVMQILLEDAGYKVKTTQDGSEIFGLVQEEKPNLILLDVWMSGMNGSDICRQLKHQKETMGIPIILVSANKDTEKLAREVSANGFISKPFDVNLLLDKINENICV